MKKTILGIISLVSLSAILLSSARPHEDNSVEVRGGAWPINLERTTDRPGVSFSLIFRDQETMNGVLLDTLDFENIEQLRYFSKGLAALKVGTNGDIARFKDYTITRADKKFEGIWYILRPEYGSTSFQQPEADIITQAIKEW
ncbi:MAG TPA: hypothetical protein VG605_11485 [Puia sp.]|nr:hypothetical protein [Puia sp.]